MLEGRLSQGDVVKDVVVATSLLFPKPYVKQKTLPTRRDGSDTGERHVWEGFDTWSPTSKAGEGVVLAKARRTLVVVTSHSCEIDKDETKARVHVAPVLAITTIQEAHRENIMAGAKVSLMPLPGVPGVGDCYADLRLEAPIDRRFLADRGTSMTEEGRRRLQRHLVAFRTRLDLDTDERQVEHLTCLACGERVVTNGTPLVAGSVLRCGPCGREMRITEAKSVLVLRTTLVAEAAVAARAPAPDAAEEAAPQVPAVREPTGG